MSGGSWDYAYARFGEVADRLAVDPDPRRRALAKVVARVAKAMKAIEWKDSCDTSEDAAEIDAALGRDAPALVLAELIESAEKARAELDEAIHRARTEVGR